VDTNTLSQILEAIAQVAGEELRAYPVGHEVLTSEVIQAVARNLKVNTPFLIRVVEKLNEAGRVESAEEAMGG
jgi:hypothetical protein